MNENYCLVVDSNGRHFIGDVDYNDHLIPGKNSMVEKGINVTTLRNVRRVWYNWNKIDLRGINLSSLIGAFISFKSDSIDLIGKCSVFKLSNNFIDSFLESARVLDCFNYPQLKLKFGRGTYFLTEEIVEKSKETVE